MDAGVREENIIFVCLISAPEGIARFTSVYPKVLFFVIGGLGIISTFSHVSSLSCVSHDYVGSDSIRRGGRTLGRA